MTDKNEKMKVVFAPGCFDGFEGTQEELNELIAQIEKAVESGEIFEMSEPLSEEGLAELEEQLSKQVGKTLQ